jgi:hypothetical protein
MWDHLAPVVAGAALLFSVCTFVVGLLMRQSMLQVVAEVAKLETKLSGAISESRDEIDDRMARHSREFGETANALRTKVHEVETWVRDTFVRRDDFLALAEKLDKSFERLEAKIDEHLLNRHRMKAKDAP